MLDPRCQDWLDDSMIWHPQWWCGETPQVTAKSPGLHLSIRPAILSPRLCPKGFAGTPCEARQPL